MQFKLPTLTEAQLQARKKQACELIATVEAMIKQLGKRTPGLLLMIVLGEGQVLDEHCKDGVRHALERLRELQLRVSRYVRVLPICTGIDPQTNLAHSSDGMNVPVNTKEEALMSMEEFDILLRSITPSDVQDKDIRLFTALTWPRVGSVMAMQHHHEGFRFSVNTHLEWKSNMDVRRILQGATYGSYSIAPNEVPTNMIRLACAGGYQCPVIDFSVLDSFRAQLLDEEWSHLIPTSVDLKDLSTQSWGMFEHNAFRTLALFLGFFYHKRADSDNLPDDKNTDRLSTWVPWCVKVVSIVGRLKNELNHCHPFKSKSHDTRDQLSEEFSTALKTLQKVGDTILVHCGGLAAIDFILVVLEEDNRLEVRYADAQFKQDPHDTSVEVDAMFKEAEKVNTALRDVLRGQFTVPEWDDRNFLLITNSQLEGNCVMSPLTTTWEPMTRLLYRSVGSEDVQVGVVGGHNVPPPPTKKLRRKRSKAKREQQPIRKRRKCSTQDPVRECEAEDDDIESRKE